MRSFAGLAEADASSTDIILSPPSQPSNLLPPLADHGFEFLPSPVENTHLQHPISVAYGDTKLAQSRMRLSMNGI